MNHEASPRVQGALVGLAVVALAAIFFLVLLPLVPRGVDEITQPKPLRSWSNERIFSEMGEYDQRLDCSQFGAQGLTAYVWVQDRAQRVVFVCTP